MPALSIRKLSMEYVRGNPVLRGISLDVSDQGITAIIGMSQGAVVYDGAAAGLSDAQLKTIYGGADWLHG